MCAHAIAYARIVYCLCVHEAVCHAGLGNVPAPQPSDQCWVRQRTCCADASSTDIHPRMDLCSTDQAPESLNLCCHSLPSDGRDRPFRGRVPNPLVRAHVPTVSGSGKGAWAGMLRGTGWDGVVCTDLRTFTMCRVGYPRGACGETPPGDLGAGAQCSSHLGRVHRTCG